jgi:adenylate cyclase, class 2
MPQPRIPFEVEIKINLVDAASGRKLLRRTGFRVSRPRALEFNTLFDTKDGRFQENGLLVRLRSYGGTSVVTYKGPAELTAGSRKGSLHRSRVEYETSVSTPEALLAIWSQLGLEPRFRYEKYRTYFKRPADPGGVAMLDETPIGDFLELEGKAYWIDRVAALLGFSTEDYLQESYVSLHAAECRKLGKPFGDMLFHPRRSNAGKRRL